MDTVTGCQYVTIGLVWQHSDRDDTTGSQYPVGVQPKNIGRHHTSGGGQPYDIGDTEHGRT